MKEYLGPTVATAMGLAVTASLMVAQPMGNPVYAPGGSGLTLALDHGRFEESRVLR